MKKVAVCVLLLLAIEFGVVSAQKPGSISDVERLDPALDAIVPPNAKLEILKADYFGIAEGPVWVQEGSSGYLLFTDISANHIYKWTPDGKLSVFQDHTGFNSTDTSSLQTAGYIGGYNGRFYPVGFGSNGTTIDPQGRIVWCAQGDRAIVRLEKDGTRTVLADHFEGKRLNRPNDLVAKSDGWIYFTDPRSRNPGAAQEFDYSGVYRVKDGKVELLDKEVQPNGLVFSPDEKIFYVGGAKIWRYDVQPDGTIANRKEINSVGCDGMKVDIKGNIYCATSGTSHGVRVLTPEGKHLGTILTLTDGVGVGPTNLAFGDADSKMLYITIRRSIARIRLNIPGVRPKPAS